MLRHYKYPFKVWLTSMILGGTFYYLYDLISSYNYRSEYMVGSDPFFLILILGMSLTFSIPCLILFVVIYNFLMDMTLSAFKIKLILLAISEVAIFLWMYILIDGGINHSMFEYLSFIGPFSLVTGASIWFYKLNKVNIDGY